MKLSVAAVSGPEGLGVATTFPRPEGLGSLGYEPERRAFPPIRKEREWTGHPFNQICPGLLGREPHLGSIKQNARG